MSYEELLHKGLIKRFKASPAQARTRMERDIQAAKTMLANDRDWAFSMAYNRDYDRFELERKPLLGY
jgi:hypothetical protein